MNMCLILEAAIVLTLSSVPAYIEEAFETELKDAVFHQGNLGCRKIIG